MLLLIATKDRQVIRDCVIRIWTSSTKGMADLGGQILN